MFMLARERLKDATPFDEATTGYLILEGAAGDGIVNGDCSITPLPVSDAELTRLLLIHIALEHEMKAGDRVEAICLGDLTPDEIEKIPDRPTGISAWFVACSSDGDPIDFKNKERVLRDLCELHAAPDARFALETVARTPAITAKFLLALTQT